MKTRVQILPIHGWLGFGLVIVFWTLNWSLTGLRSHWCFFPLWTGYCLVIDALVFARKGTSLMTRNVVAYIALFFISIPGWWLFELVNWRTQNWHYEGSEWFTTFQYVALTSLGFSTVMPAVFGTAELVSTFDRIKRIRPCLPTVPARATLLTFFAVGWIMLALLLIWPVFFFPFAWLSVYFIIEPVNVWLSNRSLVQYTSKGDWRPVIALWLGCLVCGFFWELWNFNSYPKWIYHIPFVDYWRIFEMPLLGYGGYLPFSLELYALYHLIAGCLGSKTLQGYIQIFPT